MALAANFKTMLRKNMDDVKKPEPLPEGTYRAVIKGFSLDESAKKKTPFVRYNVVPTEALDGVDSDELALSLQGAQLQSKKLRMDFYFTEDALYRFKEFCASVGVDTSGRSIEDCLQDTNNQEVLIDVTKTPSEDGESFYNNIKAMRGVEA